jgi:hypothetical protein
VSGGAKGGGFDDMTRARKRWRRVDQRPDKELRCIVKHRGALFASSSLFGRWRHSTTPLPGTLLRRVIKISLGDDCGK